MWDRERGVVMTEFWTLNESFTVMQNQLDNVSLFSFK